MLVGGERGHGVLGEDEVVAEVGGGAGGGLDAEVGGDAAEDQGGGAVRGQQLVESGVVEAADGALDDDGLAVPDEVGDEFAAGRLGVDVRPLDPDVDDGGVGGPEGGGEPGRGGEGVGAGAGCEGQRDDAFHEVDEDERGTAGIERGEAGIGCGHGSTVAARMIIAGRSWV